MIALRLTVPVACWKKGPARVFLESESTPPPATCYGALLSLVGEEDRERHRGCRVTAGHLRQPSSSTVLRTLWRFKFRRVPQGNRSNAAPDFQQLLLDSDLVIWCDSSGEPPGAGGIEARVVEAFRNPASIERAGGWSLGESTHLINDAWLLETTTPPSPCRVFLLEASGDLTMPTWVDHVGAVGTRYAVGRLTEIRAAPVVEQLPMIPLP